MLQSSYKSPKKGLNMENISLSPDVKSFLQNQVASGVYKSLSDAINANIGIVIVQTSMAKKRKDIINAEIKKGLDNVKEGRVSDGLAFIDELITEYEK